jgi:transposase
MQRFAKTIRQDLEAVRNAMSEPWSNGQTEGQINRLKTLKRAMYGRAGVDPHSPDEVIIWGESSAIQL